jgi:hypothetical protein
MSLQEFAPPAAPTLLSEATLPHAWSSSDCRLVGAGTNLTLPRSSNAFLPVWQLQHHR